MDHPRSIHLIVVAVMLILPAQGCISATEGSTSGAGPAAGVPDGAREADVDAEGDAASATPHGDISGETTDESSGGGSAGSGSVSGNGGGTEPSADAGGSDGGAPGTIDDSREGNVPSGDKDDLEFVAWFPRELSGESIKEIDPVTLYTYVLNEDDRAGTREVCAAIDGQIPAATRASPCKRVSLVPGEVKVVEFELGNEHLPGIREFTVLNASVSVEVRALAPLGTLIEGEWVDVRLSGAPNGSNESWDWEVEIFYHNGSAPVHTISFSMNGSSQFGASLEVDFEGNVTRKTWTQVPSQVVGRAHVQAFGYVHDRSCLCSVDSRNEMYWRIQ